MRSSIDAVKVLLIELPSAQKHGKEVRCAVELLDSNYQLRVCWYRPILQIERSSS